MSDQEVAALCGIHPMMIAQTVAVARRDLGADRPEPSSVTTTYDGAPGG
jgi:hypothetical protein